MSADKDATILMMALEAARFDESAGGVTPSIVDVLTRAQIYVDFLDQGLLPAACERRLNALRNKKGDLR